MQTITLITSIEAVTNLQPSLLGTGRSPVSKDTNPLRVEVQTTGGPAYLEISRDAAAELAAKLATHLQARGSP
jgi:hypothetical protein